MGGAHQGASAKGLLRQRASRRDERGRAAPVWRLLRHDGRPGLRLRECGRQLGADRPRSARGPVGRGEDPVVIRVSLPGNLQTLAGTGRMVDLEVSGLATQRSVLDALEAKYPALL